MNYVVIIGSMTFIGTNGVISYETSDGIFKEFFHFRSIDKIRSNGYYLSVDVDVKDADGEREVKIFKNNEVAISKDVELVKDKKSFKAIRKDGSAILDVEFIYIPQLSPDLQAKLKVIEGELEIRLDGVIKIFGNFRVGKYSILAERDFVLMNSHIHKDLNFGLITKVGTGGLKLGNLGLTI